MSNMPELPELVLFLTDGDPTAYNDGAGGVITSADPVTAALRRKSRLGRVRGRKRFRTQGGGSEAGCSKPAC